MSDPFQNSILAKGVMAGQRIALLDLWRFFAMCLMLVGHAVWDLIQLGVLDGAVWDCWWMLLLRYVGGGSFLLVSGAAARCSRDPRRRGFLVLCAGVLVLLVTAWWGQAVRFGVLMLLGCSMLLFGALKEKLLALPCWIWALCFVLTLPVLRCSVGVRWLYPLGLRHPSFLSADYWPVLPWTFLFLFGTGLTPALAKLPQPRLPGIVAFLSRYSLAVYLLHQPLLYGLCWLLCK